MLEACVLDPRTTLTQCSSSPVDMVSGGPVEAHISEAVKDMGFEGKLSPFQYLACLLSFALSTDGSSIQELAEQAGQTDMYSSPTTLILNKASKCVAPYGYGSGR